MEVNKGSNEKLEVEPGKKKPGKWWKYLLVGCIVCIVVVFIGRIFYILCYPPLIIDPMKTMERSNREMGEDGCRRSRMDKPVIYLYPEEKTNIDVSLNLRDAKLSCTYPKYQDGWSVTAEPDGTLYDANGLSYNYLYWEAVSDIDFDFSSGYCVKGSDTAAFLEVKLADLGLTRREANEFIIYWLPKLEENQYNVISFQTDVYTDSAELNISPKPDILLRVYMAYYASNKFVDIAEPEIEQAPERKGFVVVEWGGSEVLSDGCVSVE